MNEDDSLTRDESRLQSMCAFHYTGQCFNDEDSSFDRFGASLMGAQWPGACTRRLGVMIT